ncbi:MAG: hypothetical protein OZ921_18075 [Sorangiineae bacterium]|nr:hypothetical protein [Polyangiaceae bacterium]MEB2324427.1 hypothetical protein [Sorangiineae bacterium]
MDGDPAPVASAPEAAPRIIVERPPPGLARGEYAWPAWGIALVGGSVVAIGVGWMVVRWIRHRRAS